MGTYKWVCERWGTENIISFYVHCYEATARIQTIPVAKKKVRGLPYYKQSASMNHPRFLLRRNGRNSLQMSKTTMREE